MKNVTNDDKMQVHRTTRVYFPYQLPHAPEDHNPWPHLLVVSIHLMHKAPLDTSACDNARREAAMPGGGGQNQGFGQTPVKEARKWTM